MKLLFLLCPFLLFAQYVSFFKISHDFGMVEEGQEYTTQYHFKNLTSDTLKFDSGSIRPSCGCVTATINRAVPPLGSGVVTAKFSSTGRQGIFNKTISFRYHEQHETLLLQGYVFAKDTLVYTAAQLKKSPRLVLDKNTYNAGTVRAGEVYETQIKIRNKGKDTLKLIETISGCGGCIQVEMFGGNPAVKTNSLQPGGKGYLAISYTPTGRAANNVVTLVTNDKKNPRQAIFITGILEK